MVDAPVAAVRDGWEGDQLLADCNANQWLPVSGLCLRRLSSS